MQIERYRLIESGLAKTMSDLSLVTECASLDVRLSSLLNADTFSCRRLGCVFFLCRCNKL